MMKKLINKWKNSEMYDEYCKNFALLYPYNRAK